MSAGRGDDAAGRVADVMSPHVVSVASTTTVRQAANRLRGRGIGCLAVIDDGKLRGIVTTTDLLDLIGRGAERPIEQSVKWTMRGRGQRGGRPTDGQARG